MVNLKDFLFETTASDANFKRNIDTILRYIRKNDAEFHKKLLRAANDLLLDSKVPDAHKIICLQVVNLGLMTQNQMFSDVYFEVLNDLLLDLLTGKSTGDSDPESRARGVLKSLSLNADEKLSVEFFQLLHECIEMWAEELGAVDSRFKKNARMASDSGLGDPHGFDRAIKFLVDDSKKKETETKRSEPRDASPSRPKGGSSAALGESSGEGVGKKLAELRADLLAAVRKGPSSGEGLLRPLFRKLEDIVRQAGPADSSNPIYQEAARVLSRAAGSNDPEVLASAVFGVWGNSSPKAVSSAKGGDLGPGSPRNNKKQDPFGTNASNTKEFSAAIERGPTRQSVDGLAGGVREGQPPNRSSTMGSLPQPNRDTELENMVRNFIQNEREALSLQLRQANSKNSDLSNKLKSAEAEVTDLRHRLAESERRASDLAAQLSTRDAKANRVLDDLADHFGVRRPAAYEPPARTAPLPSPTFSMEQGQGGRRGFDREEVTSAVSLEKFRIDDFPKHLGSLPDRRTPKNFGGMGAESLGPRLENQIPVGGADLLMLKRTRTTDESKQLPPPVPSSKRPEFDATLALKDLGFGAPSYPSEGSGKGDKKNDLEFFKETLKQNSDFLQSFNDDINSILNREKTGDARGLPAAPTRTALATNWESSSKGFIKGSGVPSDRLAALSGSPIAPDRPKYSPINRSFSDISTPRVGGLTGPTSANFEADDGPLGSDRKPRVDPIRPSQFGEPEAQSDFMANFLRVRKN